MTFDQKIVLAPNPAQDVIRIFGGSSSSLTGQFDIYDSLGCLLHSVEFESIGSQTINLSDWPEGIYHYQWKDREGVRSSGSFVKQ